MNDYIESEKLELESSYTKNLCYLPKEINIDNLGNMKRSIPRNKIIARIFHDVHLIEDWGTGFQRIINGCRENNNRFPEFMEKDGAFLITFYKKKIPNKLIPLINDKDIRQVKSEGVKGEGIKGEGIKNRVKIERDIMTKSRTKSDVTGILLKEELKETLNFIKLNPGKKLPDIAKGVKKSSKTVERWIYKLKSAGLIIYNGSKRTGGYYIIYFPL
jgi:ATP-dependent DNA helicase RecG